MPKLQFWYEFASNYSYLSAMRIVELATAAEVLVEWKPFLLGPIFRAAGWDTSPFLIYPNKGRYMIRDMQRLTSSRGLNFVLPQPFPTNGLLAARLAIVGCEEGWVSHFTRRVFELEFGEGADISERVILKCILDGLSIDAEDALEKAERSSTKNALRLQTQIAHQLGIFGAPTFESGRAGRSIATAYVNAAMCDSAPAPGALSCATRPDVGSEAAGHAG